MLFYIVVVQFYNPTDSTWILNFSTYLQTPVIVCLFYSSYPRGCGMVSHCGFDPSPLPIFNLGYLIFCGCRVVGIVHDINFLLGIWFAHIFSHSVGCFFTLLMVSFNV